jgi:hypothetical protein
MALVEASVAPELFVELGGKFPDGKASDSALRSYLLTQKFTHVAADAAIRAYRDTLQLVADEPGGHTAASPNPETPIMQPAQQARTHMSGDIRARPSGGGFETTLTPASGSEPFRVSFTGSGIEITGKLTTPDVADEFIRAVTALKTLLRPVGQVQKPDWWDKAFSPGDAAPDDGPYQAHHHGHVGSGQLEMKKGDLFPACSGCVDGAVRYTVVGARPAN